MKPEDRLNLFQIILFLEALLGSAIVIFLNYNLLYRSIKFTNFGYLFLTTSLITLGTIISYKVSVKNTFTSFLKTILNTFKVCMTLSLIGTLIFFFTGWCSKFSNRDTFEILLSKNIVYELLLSPYLFIFSIVVGLYSTFIFSFLNTIIFLIKKWLTRCKNA
jgi:hypothetical protein